MCCRGGACCVCVSGGRAGSSPGCGELAGRHPRRGAQYGKIPIIARIEGSTPAAGRSGRRQVDFIPGEKFNAACRRVRGGAAVHQASRTSFSSIQRHIAQRWAISGTKAGRIPGGNDSLGGRRQSAVHAGGPSRLRRTWTYLNYDPELRWRCSKARRREERRASGGAARPDDGPVERSDPSSTRRRPVVGPSSTRRRPLKRSDTLHTVGGRRGLDATYDHPRPAPASARLHCRDSHRGLPRRRPHSVASQCPVVDVRRLLDAPRSGRACGSPMLIAARCLGHSLPETCLLKFIQVDVTARWRAPGHVPTTPRRQEAHTARDRERHLGSKKNAANCNFGAIPGGRETLASHTLLL